MVQSITLTLPADVRLAVEELSRKEGVTPDEVINRAVRQHVFLLQFRSLRERLVARATDQGLVADQDVFDCIS